MDTFAAALNPSFEGPYAAKLFGVVCWIVLAIALFRRWPLSANVDGDTPPPSPEVEAAPA